MIAIKGMEMPKECYMCPLLDGEYGVCQIIGETKMDMTEERAKNCPLVEIVTCKDCKYLCCIEGAPKVLVCGKHNCQQVSKNFYCADGERRE